GRPFGRRGRGRNGRRLGVVVQRAAGLRGRLRRARRPHRQRLAQRGPADDVVRRARRVSRGPLPEGLRPATLAVRGGQERTPYDETAEPLFLTQGYIYPTAAECEAAFTGEIDRYVYSRYGNPTVTNFEERLRLLEGAEACFATVAGMSAVFSALAAVCRAGSRVVASRALFGSTLVVPTDILAGWGVITELVDGHDVEQWRAALA